MHGGAAETVVAASAGRRGNLVETTLEALDSLFNLDRARRGTRRRMVGSAAS